MNENAICSFDIGGSKVVCARVAADLSLVEVGREATCSDDFTGFSAQIRRLAEQSGCAGPLALSIAGVTDPKSGIIHAANIPAISGRRLAVELSAATGRSVYVINDANAFGLAEAHCGVGRGHDVVFAAILGTGLGGALVFNQRILTGAGGTAGEWGHGPLPAVSAALTQRLPGAASLPQLLCGCGQTGCVETLTGARGLERLHLHLSGISADSWQILSQWHQGAAVAADTVAVFVDILGGVLAQVINVIDPSVVPLGGGLATDAALVAALNSEVNRRRLGAVGTDEASDGASDGGTDLLIAAVQGGERGLIGAALFARQAQTGAG
jgi:N-acetylglucosamine kinase